MAVKLFWQNLRKNECPYCASRVIEDDFTIKCSTCMFNVDHWKAVRIIDALILKESPGYIPKNWQNLNQKRCPIHGDDLQIIVENDRELYQCPVSNCQFTISEARINELINDPRHSEYKFNRMEINPYTYEREFKK